MRTRNWNLTLSAVFVLVATPLPTFAELIITSSESYANADFIENTDLILNYGEFRNTGIVDNLDGSEFLNYGLLFNYGSVSMHLNTSLTNYGEFDNFGNVSASSIYNGINGLFENQSNIALYEGAYNNAMRQYDPAEINNDGVFDNNGSIDSNSLFGAGLNLNNSNVFNNNGFINTNGPVQITNSGVFNNVGGFVTPWSESLSIHNTGEFNNAADLHLGDNWNAISGSIITTNRFVNHAEIQGGEAIQNSGYFENDGNITGAKSFINSGEVVNDGRISVLNEMVNLATSTFTNLYNGVVEAGSRLENRGVFENQSIVSLREGFNEATWEVLPAELDNSGVFNNNGTIDVFTDYSDPRVGFNLINSSVFNNNGFINTNGPVQITNSGVFNNLGEFITPWSESLSIHNTGEFVNGEYLNLGDNWNGLSGSIVTTNRFINHADIQGGELIKNSGYFENDGNITGVKSFINSAEVVNDGRISVLNEMVNLATSTFENIYYGVVEAGSRLENRGVFENQGNISLHEGSYNHETGEPHPAKLDNSGVFNNNGSIDVFTGYGSPTVGLNLINSNVFNNNGFINTNGPVQITNSGIFNNLGEFNTQWNTSLSIHNSGEFVNDAFLTLGDIWSHEQAGSIINTNRFINHAVIRGGASINNSGYFENDGFIDNVNSFENSGDVNNSGDITVVTEIMNLATSTFNNLVGGIVEVSQLENRGLFENQSTVSLHEGYDSSTGQLTSADLINYGQFNQHDTLMIFDGYQGFNLTNLGEFNNTGIIYDNQRSTQITNYGVFNNQGVINAYQGPTQITNYGAFNNLGEFNTSVMNINNFGEFNNSSNLYVGAGQIFNRGSFVNNGDIFDGALFNNSGYLENNLGIQVLAFENTGDVVNAGGIRTYKRLTNSATGVFTNLSNSGASAAHIDNRGMFENQSQSIVVMMDKYDPTTGQLSAAELNNSGVFNNAGDIRSDWVAGAGFNLINSNAFTNSWWISSRGTTQIINSGEFLNEGALEVTNGTLSINNSGTFTSAGGDLVGPGDIENTGTFINYSSISGFDNISSSGLFVNDGRGYANISANTVTISGRLEGGGNVTVGNGLVITESGTLVAAGALGYMNVYGDMTLDGTIDFGVESYFDPGDRMNVFGNVLLGSSSVLDVSFLDGRVFDIGSTFDLLWADSIVGGFDSFYYDAILGDGLALEWLIFDNGGQDILRLGVVSAVPLPAAFWLFLSGMIGLLSVRRKKKYLM